MEKKITISLSIEELEKIFELLGTDGGPYGKVEEELLIKVEKLLNSISKATLE